MSFVDDAFDDAYKAMFKRMHEPYEKYELNWNRNESFTGALVRSELTLEDLQELHDEIKSLIQRKGPIKCGLCGDLSEGLRFIRYSAYSVPGIGFIEDYGHKPISAKWQYRKIDDAILEAIKIRSER